jgi:membrane fusion protein, cation efflux system
MKTSSLMSSLLAVGLLVMSPTMSLAHVGHGDEFQTEGGIERVPAKAETDSILGIQVSPIEQTSTSGAGVLIPVTSLVEADGKQLVFVQYDNFYEPVPVVTGATQGDLIEVTEGLSVGEQLVTQGSLSLYAESRKTQSSEVATEEASPVTTEAHKKADAEGIPHSHDAKGNLVTEADSGQTESKSFPVGLAIALGSLAALGIGALAFLKSGSAKSSSSSVKKSKGA